MSLRDFIENNDGEVSEATHARVKALDIALEDSGSRVVKHKILVLVDLQGIYLALQTWLSTQGDALDGAFLLSRFADLQIQRTVVEICRRTARNCGSPAGYLGDLFESIRVEERKEGYFLKDEVRLLKEAIYFVPNIEIEIFYAPAPLREIAWHLRKGARKNSYTMQTLIEKVDAGIISREGVFERDYSKYGDFVSELQRLNAYKNSHEGFFNFCVKHGGIKYFDEKEVDTRIVMRAMEGILLKQCDAICVASSDQDFIPLSKCAESSGIDFFQADLAKFLTTDRIGRRLRDLGDKFISGGIDPVWPLEILTEAMTVDAIGHQAKFGLDDAEVQLLVDLHNEMNDVKVKLNWKKDGSVQIIMSRPA